MSTSTKTRNPATSAPPSSSGGEWLRSPVTWVAALVVVAALVAVGLSLLNGGDDETVAVTDDITTQTAFAEIIGDPLPRLETSPDPAIGMQVPIVSAQTLAGDRITVEADGTARLFGFFAHWCPHCQEELPVTAQWLADNPLPDGVEVIAVSTAVDETAPNYPPSEWFPRENWPATVLLDSTESHLAGGFGLSAFPYWVAVDADGTIVARMTGALDEAQLTTIVNDLAS